MMAEYNPLHSAEINSGLNVYSYHLKDNFNAIKTSTDTKLNKDSATTQTVAGTVIFNQLEATQFSGNPVFSGTPTISNLGLGVTSLTPVADLNAISTAGHVVTNDATSNKPTATGVYTVTTLAGNASTSATQTAVHTVNAGEAYIRQKTAGTWGAWRQLSDRVYALGDSIRGAAPTFTSATSITMGAGLICADSTRTSLISVPSATVINFATTGLNGLDTGTIASNTWYYVHAILNPTTGATGYIASTSRTSPTMPSGFTIRRLLPYLANTGSSANVMRVNQTLSGNTLTYRYADLDGHVLVDKSFGTNNTLWHSFSSGLPDLGSNINVSILGNLYARSDNTIFTAYARPSGSSASGIPIYDCECYPGATGVQTLRYQVVVPVSPTFPYGGEIRHTSGSGTWNRSILSFGGFIAEVIT